MTHHEQRPAIDLYQPIPLELPSVVGWKELPVHESGEPLVPLGIFSDNDIFLTSAVYRGELDDSPYWSAENRLQGALTAQFVREGVAERLHAAESLLPANHHLIILDSYRPLRVQRALYDHYIRGLAQQHPDWTEEQLSTETQKYVSIPSHDKTRPSPHNTGGSVDVAIIELSPEIEARLQATTERITVLRAQAPQTFTVEDEARNPILRELYLQQMTKQHILRSGGKFLEFGTPFDHGGPEAASNYLEHKQQTGRLDESELIALHNRRLLYNVMNASGMEAYEEEWWHFNAPESQMGAKTAGLDHATYGAAELSVENQAFEDMRSQHLMGLMSIQEAILLGLPKWSEEEVWQELIDLNTEALVATGHPRSSPGLGRAAIIAPPTKVNS